MARRWSGVVLAIGGTLTAVMITKLILKPLIGRLRYGHLAFPSGHTTATGLAAVLVAASVAVALIARHIHYATDTVAGSCVALATPLLTLALDFFAPRVRSVPPRISQA